MREIKGADEISKPIPPEGNPIKQFKQLFDKLEDAYPYTFVRSLEEWMESRKYIIMKVNPGE